MKITTKKTDTRTFEEVELRTPITDDLIKAKRIAGEDTGLEFMVAVLSQIGTFDGAKLPPEELRKMSAADLVELGNALAPMLAEAGGEQ
ncbi:MAG: phage tail assembly protein [Chlorobiaceae bacterium]|nr:phage tail assembly protein [Chlorobiaceae bacterium]